MVVSEEEPNYNDRYSECLDIFGTIPSISPVQLKHKSLAISPNLAPIQQPCITATKKNPTTKELFLILTPSATAISMTSLKPVSRSRNT
jgi:hypothetical protein